MREVGKLIHGAEGDVVALISRLLLLKVVQESATLI
jgi:hypothetical protein